MKTWKKILFILVVLIFIIVACVLSWYFGFKKGIQVGGMTKSMAEIVIFDEHLKEQFANASCEGTRQAINEYLEILERHKHSEGSLITNTSYYADKMLSHLRLARIEHKLGNLEKEAKHLELAKEACAHRAWKDCSVENMSLFVTRIEEKVPMACLANEK